MYDIKVKQNVYEEQTCKVGDENGSMDLTQLPRLPTVQSESW